MCMSTGWTVDEAKRTQILYQCSKCGKLKMKTIKGHWEVDKLNKLVKAVNFNRESWVVKRRK